MYHEGENFEIEKYKLDRAHELELNKFTHVLEVERLKLLIFLNGGAAAAWLTFSKTDSTPTHEWPALALIVGPTLFWLLGLISAFLATEAALTTQREFTKAYHRRRRADEWRTMRRSSECASINLPRSSDQIVGEKEEAAYSRTADRAIKDGQAAHKRVGVWTIGSVGAFVLGAVLAGALIAASNVGTLTIPSSEGGEVNRNVE